MLLPMTAFASVFGMNLMDDFGSSSAALFWLTVIGSLLLGGVLSWFIARMPKQLRRESQLERLVDELRHQRDRSSGPDET